VLEYFDPHALHLLYQPKAGETPGTGLPARPGYAQSAVYFELEESGGRDVEEAFNEVDSLLVQCGTGIADTWGAMDEAELDKMARFRHAVPETINTLIAQRQKRIPALHKLGTDFAVGDDALENLIRLYRRTLDASGLEYVLFGHIGENHLHINIIPENEDELARAKAVYMELAKAVVRMGGTLSAEHGIGKIKKYLLGIQYDSKAIDEMKRIKIAFDPHLLLNQGNLF
jgi:D-lactate dehydrogenase (cytochrome)